jgi:hypothetical protein
MRERKRRIHHLSWSGAYRTLCGRPRDGLNVTSALGVSCRACLRVLMQSKASPRAE